MGSELGRALWPVVRSLWLAVIAAGLLALVALRAVEELPSLLPAAIRLAAPDLDVEVAGAQVDVLGGIALRGLRVRDRATGELVLEAEQATIRFSPAGLLARRVDEIRLDGAVVTVPATVPGADGGGATAGAWRIGRFASRDARLRVPPRGDLPAITARVHLDLRHLGTDPAVAERPHRLVLKDVVVGTTPAAPLLRMRGAVVDASVAGLLERRHVEGIRLVHPRVTIGDALPALGGGASHPDDDAGPGWTLGRLVVSGGLLSMQATADRPGATFRFRADLDDLGTDAARAARRHQVNLAQVAVALPGGAGVLAADAIAVRASVAGLSARRVDEVKVRQPVVTAPGDASLRQASAPGQPGEAAPAWTVGRLATDDGRLELRASGKLPGVSGAFRLDLRELGLEPAHASIPHRVHLRDLHVRYTGRAPSVTVDAGSVDFTVAGLLRHRQIARLDVAHGVVVLDRTFRERLAAPGEGTGTAGAWSIGVVDIDQLGIRLANLGPRIPDVTLLVRTRLTGVPLGGVALATSRQPQRIELSDISLDSPLDPFRPVVRVGSLFVDFTLADLLQRQIAGMTIVSPTIYLGEDLVWYRDAARDQAAGTGGDAPWTVRRLRVELGRIVVTYDGLDRTSVPLSFRTDARNVVLGELATLQLAAALEVPRQDYRFPGLGLDLLGVRGELRFDFPPSSRAENVVNTLEVDTIRWRHYRITDGWLSATFDHQGINGSLGGGAYEGYVNGGLSIPYGAGTMAGWAACTDLDLQPIAASVGSRSFYMTGVVNLEASMEALGTQVERANADLVFARPGVLRFPALDELMSKLPAEAPSWQRDLLRAAVDAFAEYPYTAGGGTVRYAAPRGEAHLKLASDRGTRRIDVHYYRDAPVVADVRGEGR